MILGVEGGFLLPHVILFEGVRLFNIGGKRWQDVRMTEGLDVPSVESLRMQSES